MIPSMLFYLGGKASHRLLRGDVKDLGTTFVTSSNPACMFLPALQIEVEGLWKTTGEKSERISAGLGSVWTPGRGPHVVFLNLRGEERLLVPSHNRFDLFLIFMSVITLWIWPCSWTWFESSGGNWKELDERPGRAVHCSSRQKRKVCISALGIWSQ